MIPSNNIYFAAGEPVAKYVKTAKFSLSGLRLDPNDKKLIVHFILADRENDAFNYEREVIELYSKEELNHFMTANRYLFAQGFIAEYDEERKPVDTTNVLTDEDIITMAALPSFEELKRKLDELTSIFTVKRILETSYTLGRNKRFTAAFEKYVETREAA